MSWAADKIGDEIVGLALSAQASSATGEVRACRVADIFGDPASAELFAEYTAESANPVTGSISPQRGMYEALEGYGTAKCFAAFVDGKMCGFALVLIAILPHYGKRFATVESFFLSGATRSYSLYRRLREAAKERAKAEGCNAIFYSAPVGGSFERLLLLDDACVHTNSIFTESLA